MIPLIKNLDVDEINTSLIAIRKLLNNVGITETNITNIIGKDYDAKIQELEEKVEADSIYSTTEHWTGKYWKDGKKIYKQTFSRAIANGETLVRDVDTLVDQYGSIAITTNIIGPFPGVGIGASVAIFRQNTTSHTIYSDFSQTWTCNCTVEYTKTTD